MNYRLLVMPIMVSAILSCNNSTDTKTTASKYKTVGTIDRIDPSLDSIISPDAKIEVIADSFDWSEGPVWIESKKMLLFSDVKQNTVYKWTEEKGKEVFLTPSGYSDSVKRGGEMGSNGLTLDPNGQLALCQHGNRQVARMDASLDEPKSVFIPIASHYKGKRFNS